jgi:DNA-binding XRE family transcriptional regulator
MSKPLTAEQLAALRSVPVTDDTKNRLRVAIAIVNVRQVDLVEETGLSQKTVTNIVNGLVPNIPLPTARLFADYFGCAIEDLFPAQVAA